MGKRSFPGPTSGSIYRYRFRDYPYSGLGMLERASVSNLQYSCNVPLRACGVARGLKRVESLEWTEGLAGGASGHKKRAKRGRG